MPWRAKDYSRVSIAICILAKNEGRVIAESLAQLAKQSIIHSDDEDIDIHVVANGCTDDTVEVARLNHRLFYDSRTKLHVHDLNPGGKSRAWNRAVHELICRSSEYIVFLDADITFADNDVLTLMLNCLKDHPEPAAISGFPVKDVSLNSKKSVFDRFSLMVSERSRERGAINGSLYVVRARFLVETWLPDQTPGEDGFLNAMLTTRGFTKTPDSTLVTTPTSPTHSFQAHNPLGFLFHERRMIVGTMINRWIFEHLWSLSLTLPAGPLIRDWNRVDPGWVERLVHKRIDGHSWLIPNAILFGRFKIRGPQSYWKKATYIPIATAATLLTLLPAILANKRLKEVGATSTW